ncbi:glycosyltransferase family 8 protein [bacterium]|nr:glycosyltransferase family 8 protein [bacterium]MBQ9149733.1 glycosyltransferase family 8 protein [bacterium]
MTNTIPIMQCFDNNYALAAGVACYSLLKNANKDFNYSFNILHTDISDKNQKLLRKTINAFPNAKLNFINMENKFDNLFQKTKSKAHFSKEMYYKLIAPSIFPEYEKIIITDVDVIFISDISKIYNQINTNEDYYLLAPNAGRTEERRKEIKEKYYSNFSDEEFDKLVMAAGLMIYNLEKMRNDNIEDKLINYIENNFNRVWLPEQDTISEVCYPKIKFFTTNTLYCNTMQSDKPINELADIVQLHYVGENKPWMSNCPCADIWFKYLIETPFLDVYLENIEKIYYEKKNPKTKTIFSFNPPFYKKKFVLVKIPKFE